jgi:small-conductance mechanosensitive channel
MVAIFLLSIVISIGVAEEALLAHPLSKIFVILIILVLIYLVSKGTICFAEDYCKKAERAKIFRNALFLIRSGISITLYIIAVILIIEILSPQLGVVIALFGALFMAFAFALFYNQMRDVVAGMQIADRYVKSGDYVKIKGIEGYVEEVRGRTTVIKSPHGTTFRIPNHMLTGEVIENFSAPGGGNIWRIRVVCLALESKKIEKTITATLLKAMRGIGGIAKGYKPSVDFLGIRDGRAEFSIRFQLVPFADIRAIDEKVKRELGSALRRFKLVEVY